MTEGGGGVPGAGGSVPGLAADARKPAANDRKVRQIEVAFIGHVSVCIERDIGDAETLGDEKAAVDEVAFHYAERPVSGFPLRFHQCPALVGELEMLERVSGNGDIRLVAALLEKHPLKRPGTLEIVVR